MCFPLGVYHPSASSMQFTQTHHMPRDDGLGRVTDFLPDLCDMGSLYWWHNDNLRRFTFATEILAVFTGPPTTERSGSESAENSRSSHLNKVLGSHATGYDTQCHKVLAYSIQKNYERSIEFCGNSGVLVNIYTAPSTMPSLIISPS